MASSTWLQAAISVAFVGEGVWRLVASGKMTSTPDRATAIFNFVNFLLFGLLGLSCVCWPVVSTWFDRKRECDSSLELCGSQGPSSADPNNPPSTPETQEVLQIQLLVNSGVFREQVRLKRWLKPRLKCIKHIC